MDDLTIALALAGGIIVLGSATGRQQIVGLRGLAARTHVPSDEHAYLRARYRRRLLNSAILILLGMLIAGAYLSGMEAVASNLPEHFNEDQQVEQTPNGEKKPKMTEGQKRFIRLWSSYWILCVVFAFVLIAVALTDAIETRRYWYAQYKAMREEHQTILERDLAVYKRQKEQSRLGRYGNHRGGSDAKE